MTEPVQGADELQRRIEALGDTRKFLGQLGLMAVAKAKQLVPRKTGNLGRTIRLGQVTDKEVQLLAGGQNGVGYAQAVEFGSRPHDIVPRVASVLSWPASGADARLSGSVRSGGKRAYAKRVHHPGTKPQPFLIPAAEEVVSESGMELLVKAWNDAA